MLLQKEIEKIFPQLETIFSETALNSFAETDSSKLCQFHFSIGLWIRNNLLRGEENSLRAAFARYDVSDDDEMSYVVLKQFHDYLNSKYTLLT
ncbi:MAG: hypothetical protein FWG82_06540 [Oscillospiraceae bacterium]|nr:hypothetical protein [Oscillospiraceae bacterium]